MKRVGLSVLLLLSACNFSKVEQGDPLYGYVGTSYYLATPLSGPSFRNSNMFGQRPVFDAGTKVRVTSVERVPKAFDATWLLKPAGIRAVERYGYKPLYRIFFDGPEACGSHGCVARWRVLDEADFRQRFQSLFVQDDPLAKVAPEALVLIKKHQVAGWMSLRDVLLSFGQPNFVVSSFGRDHWVYETRQCDALGRMLAIPKVGLVFRGAKLEDHEALAESDWYVLLDPGGMAGACYNPYNGPGTGIVGADGSGVLPSSRPFGQTLYSPGQ